MFWAHPRLRRGPGYPLQQKALSFSGLEFAHRANSKNKKPVGFLFRSYPLRGRFALRRRQCGEPVNLLALKLPREPVSGFLGIRSHCEYICIKIQNHCYKGLVK
jgi:hypothetical protein